MKKSFTYASLSALLLTLVGLVLAFIVDGVALFTGVIQTITALFPNDWPFLIVPGFSFILLILLVIFKATRKVKGVWLPISYFLSILAVLVVGPTFWLNLLESTVDLVVPESLAFTTGGTLIVLSHLFLMVLAIVDLLRVLAHKTKQKELASEVYTPIEETVEEKEAAPVEFSDEEVEDEGDEEDDESEDVAKNSKTKKAKETDRIYHVMKRAKDDQWVVKIAQRKKAIRIFATQKEAIAYAEALATNNNGVVRVFASKGANKGRIIV